MYQNRWNNVVVVLVLVLVCTGLHVCIVRDCIIDEFTLN